MDCFGKGKAHIYEIKVKVCYIDGLFWERESTYV